MKKYDDDELAEAALLLGAVEAKNRRESGVPLSTRMPAALQKKLIEEGRAQQQQQQQQLKPAVAQRQSTTQAGALSLALTLPEETTTATTTTTATRTDSDSSRPSRSFRKKTTPRSQRFQHVTSWVPWFAAAACFAFAIYEWRSASTRSTTVSSSSNSTAREPEPPAAVAPLRPVPIVIVKDGASSSQQQQQQRTLAEIVNVTCGGADKRQLTGEIHVRREMPLLEKEDEHYRVWVSNAASAPNVHVVGSFACSTSSSCQNRVFTFSQPLQPNDTAEDCTRSLKVFITRNKTSDPLVRREEPFTAETVVGEGRRMP